MNDYYFDGDPEVDSTRRQLERLMRGSPPRRRWPWVIAAFAGGAAFTYWRLRSSRTAAPRPAGEVPAAPPRDRQEERRRG